MYIVGREGKFLNTREIKQLLVCVESYVRAIEVNGTTNKTADDDIAYEKARAIDASGKDGNGQAGDNQGDLESEGTGESPHNKVVALKALIEIFEARITTSSHAYHIQSPFMVGSAEEIDNSTPTTWALV